MVQVAVDRTAPNGRVLGIDLIPAQPPKGASTIQGNFLSPAVQAEVRKFLRDPERGRVRQQRFFTDQDDADASLSEEDLEESKLGYVDLERHASLEESDASRPEPDAADPKRQSQKAKDDAERRNVDVVLSDMSAPWEQTSGFWKRSLSAPYSRMMNTSGIPFRDHAGSMVCLLSFSIRKKNSKAPKYSSPVTESLPFDLGSLHRGASLLCRHPPHGRSLRL